MLRRDELYEANVKARIQIPESVLLLVTEEEREEANRLAEELIEAGGKAEDEYNLEYYIKIIRFEGPDDKVRPLITHVMNLIHKYTPRSKQ